MCGIVAVVRRGVAAELDVPALEPLVAALDDAEARLRQLTGRPDADAINAVADAISAVERDLRGAGGATALLTDPVRMAALEHRAASLSGLVGALDAALDVDGAGSGEIEAMNAAVVAVKDACWSLHRDRMRTARAIDQLGAS